MGHTGSAMTVRKSFDRHPRLRSPSRPLSLTDRPGRCPARPRRLLDEQVVAYVAVQVALAADDFEGAQAAAADLSAIADATTAPLVRSVVEAGDIETMRARFKPLSEYLRRPDATRRLRSRLLSHV